MLVGHKSKNHPQQIHVRGADEDTDDRRTPDGIWLPLHAEFSFTVDAAARAHNTKLPRYFEDGLSTTWGVERVWCNPPYSDLTSWVAKAHTEVAALTVMLLPANRTEQRWWQSLVEPFRDRGGRLSSRFLSGRRRFVRPSWQPPAKGDRPPFGLVLLIWSP